MDELYTYILAPNLGDNKQIMFDYCRQYPEIVEDQRVKDVSKKDPFDVLDNEGNPLAKAGAKYFYMKVLTSMFDPSMIAGVVEAQVFTRQEQPYTQFWL